MTVFSQVVGRGGVVVLLALGLAGCSDDSVAESSAPPGSSGLEVTATLDRETAAITVPLDRYSVTYKEGADIFSAQSLAMSKCMTAAGFSFSPTTFPTDPLYDASNFFGVWTSGMAERFAFVMPMTEADMRANGVTFNSEPIPESTAPARTLPSNNVEDPEVQAGIERCLTEPEISRFDFQFPPTPWAADADAAYDSAKQSQEWKDAVADYHECLRSRGMEPDLSDDQLSVTGGDSSVIDAEQISLALEVVACKDQVKLVKRLAGQIAAFQAPIVDEYAVELTALREYIDQFVSDSRAYLTAEGAASD